MPDFSTDMTLRCFVFRYINSKGRIPEDHEAVLSMTKGHVALGGGGLGLFGSGCLHTWPDNLEQVQHSFQDATPIDKLNFMDDSAYRFFSNWMFGTSVGSIAGSNQCLWEG